MVDVSEERRQALLRIRQRRDSEEALTKEQARLDRSVHAHSHVCTRALTQHRNARTPTSYTHMGTHAYRHPPLADALVHAYAHAPTHARMLACAH